MRRNVWFACALLLLAAIVAAVWIRARAPAPSAPAAALPPAEPRAEPAPTPTSIAPHPSPSPSSEASQMAQLRELVDAEPARAVELAGELEERYPRGESSAERALLKMRALVHLNQIGRARDEAVRFFEAYPESPLGAEVSQLTGLRPRNLPRAGP